MLARNTFHISLQMFSTGSSRQCIEDAFFKGAHCKTQTDAHLLPLLVKAVTAITPHTVETMECT